VTGRRRVLGIAGGLGLVGVLLVLPAPSRPALPVPGGPAASAAGPPALATVWPHATVFSLPAVFPDGSTYQPQLLLDSTTSVGLATSRDALRTLLVVAGPSGPPRVLDSVLVNDGGSFDAVTPTPDRLYWMRTVSDADGHAHVSLWTAGRSSGPATQVTPDAGAALFNGSRYDMQVAGGRLYWVAATGTADSTELRSVPLAGGSVTVRTLPGAWTMTAWPWLVTAPGPAGGRVELFNPDTGQRVPVRAPANKSVTCGRTWCRLIADNAAQVGETDLVRPDGSDLTRIGDQNAVAIASDVALLDRFEPLLTALTSLNATTVSRLDLYDIAGRRTVRVEAAATGAMAKGDYLWWSTGDNETAAWHAVDLRTLG
jgi:hypothetical protein